MLEHHIVPRNGGGWTRVMHTSFIFDMITDALNQQPIDFNNFNLPRIVIPHPSHSSLKGILGVETPLNIPSLAREAGIDTMKLVKMAKCISAYHEPVNGKVITSDWSEEIAFKRDIATTIFIFGKHIPQSLHPFVHHDISKLLDIKGGLSPINSPKLRFWNTETFQRLRCRYGPDVSLRACVVAAVVQARLELRRRELTDMLLVWRRDQFIPRTTSFLDTSIRVVYARGVRRDPSSYWCFVAALAHTMSLSMPRFKRFVDIPPEIDTIHNPHPDGRVILDVKLTMDAVVKYKGQGGEYPVFAVIHELFRRFRRDGESYLRAVVKAVFMVGICLALGVTIPKGVKTLPVSFSSSTSVDFERLKKQQAKNTRRPIWTVVTLSEGILNAIGEPAFIQDRVFIDRIFNRAELYYILALFSIDRGLTGVPDPVVLLKGISSHLSVVVYRNVSSPHPLSLVAKPPSISQALLAEAERRYSIYMSLDTIDRHISKCESTCNERIVQILHGLETILSEHSDIPHELITDTDDIKSLQRHLHSVITVFIVSLFVAPHLQVPQDPVAELATWHDIPWPSALRRSIDDVTLVIHQLFTPLSIPGLSHTLAHSSMSGSFNQLLQTQLLKMLTAVQLGLTPAFLHPSTKTSQVLSMCRNRSKPTVAVSTNQEAATALADGSSLSIHFKDLSTIGILVYLADLCKSDVSAGMVVNLGGNTFTLPVDSSEISYEVVVDDLNAYKRLIQYETLATSIVLLPMDWTYEIKTSPFISQDPQQSCTTLLLREQHIMRRTLSWSIYKEVTGDQTICRPVEAVFGLIRLIHADDTTTAVVDWKADRNRTQRQKLLVSKLMPLTEAVMVTITILGRMSRLLPQLGAVLGSQLLSDLVKSIPPGSTNQNSFLGPLQHVANLLQPLVPRHLYQPIMLVLALKTSLTAGAITAGTVNLILEVMNPSHTNPTPNDSTGDDLSTSESPFSSSTDVGLCRPLVDALGRISALKQTGYPAASQWLSYYQRHPEHLNPLVSDTEPLDVLIPVVGEKLQMPKRVAQDMRVLPGLEAPDSLKGGTLACLFQCAALCITVQPKAMLTTVKTLLAVLGVPDSVSEEEDLWPISALKRSVSKAQSSSNVILITHSGAFDPTILLPEIIDTKPIFVTSSFSFPLDNEESAAVIRIGHALQHQVRSFVNNFQSLSTRPPLVLLTRIQPGIHSRVRQALSLSELSVLSPVVIHLDRPPSFTAALQYAFKFQQRVGQNVQLGDQTLIKHIPKPKPGSMFFSKTQRLRLGLAIRHALSLCVQQSEFVDRDSFILHAHAMNMLSVILTRYKEMTKSGNPPRGILEWASPSLEHLRSESPGVYKPCWKGGCETAPFLIHLDALTGIVSPPHSRWYAIDHWFHQAVPHNETVSFASSSIHPNSSLLMTPRPSLRPRFVLPRNLDLIEFDALFHMNRASEHSEGCYANSWFSIQRNVISTFKKIVMDLNPPSHHNTVIQQHISGNSILPHQLSDYIHAAQITASTRLGVALSNIVPVLLTHEPLHTPCVSKSCVGRHLTFREGPAPPFMHVRGMALWGATLNEQTLTDTDDGTPGVPELPLYCTFARTLTTVSVGVDFLPVEIPIEHPHRLFLFLPFRDHTRLEWKLRGIDCVPLSSVCSSLWS
eukprot:gnl/Dysnectes_brevis/3876_a5012_431.p1 GENE.gnl/Dysnectes_brevis/3876_a5012_431~~gnl/Dysnectes_brevis/3876_a5012_431.p1  ORF type:complete len:1679 (+),score=196.06 gnl/Dysnectes_brevis/3876_a5012_431:120-5039(+)